MGTALQTVLQSTHTSPIIQFPFTMSFQFPAFQPLEENPIRQNHPEECEALVNKQINHQLQANYVYTALVNYFTQVDQALPGFASFFKMYSCVGHRHGVFLMEYQAKRGGKVVLQDISKPSRMDWGTPLEAMTAVLELEKTLTQTLQHLQTVAAQKNDFHLTDFVQQEFVVKKVNIIKEIGDMITKIKMVSNGTGIFTLDQELQKAVVAQTLVDLQNVVSKVKHCQVNQAQVETVKEIVDCLATVTI